MTRVGRINSSSHNKLFYNYFNKVMSVYTSISRKELEKFILQYELGDIISFAGIHAGIGNTNFAVTTTQDDYILTIYETQTANELRKIFDLLKHLSLNDFPSPTPQACKKGLLLKTIKNKPAAIFSRLPGNSVAPPSITQCEEIGLYLAKLHFIGKDFNLKKQNSNKLHDWQSIFYKIKPKLSNDEASLISSELNYQLSFPSLDLPKGIIHADLFTDNVLFNQGKVSGVIDFYDACNDFFLFDIAITVNDWCFENKAFNQQKLSALLFGYQTIRTLTDKEIAHLTTIFRLAALRFWISRLKHQFNPKSAVLTLEKDPAVFRYILEYYRSSSIINICEHIV